MPGIALGLNFVGRRPTFTPAQISNLAFWVRGDQVTNDGTGKASAWPDKSLAGLLVPVQATSANRPSIVASGALNGQPCLSFNGTSQYLVCGTTNPTTGNTMSIFVVSRTSSVTDQAQLIGRVYNSLAWGIQGSHYRDSGHGRVNERVKFFIDSAEVS